MRNNLLKILLLIFVTNSILAQNNYILNDFYHLKIGDGITANSICDITQDSIGQMWFATKNGVVRYDARQLFTYRNCSDKINKMADNFITRVFVDAKARLWITTQKGVSIYNDKKDVFEYPKLKRLQTGHYNDICQDKNQNIWFLNYDRQSLIMLGAKSGTLKEYYYKPEDNEKIIRFKIDKSDKLWITTTGNYFPEFSCKTKKFKKHKIIPGQEFKKYEKLKSFAANLLIDNTNNV
jgi:ligand-binding sensor domain-containing protein